MKKMRLLLVSAALLLAMTACGKEPAVEYAYKNGTYQVQWNSGPDGYADYLEMEITDDVISVLEFDGVNEAGEKKSADSALATAMREASSPNLPQALDPKKAYAMTAERFAAADGKLEEMELVAGATETSESFKALLKALLEGNAVEGLAEKMVLPYYADGSYTKGVLTGEEGARRVLTLEVKDGAARVTELYTEKKAEGTTDTAADAPADTAAATPTEADKAVIEQLNTALSDGFLTDEDFADAPVDKTVRQLCQAALTTSHLRLGLEESDLSPLQDGVYKAEMSADTNGWKDYLIVSVSRGRVQVVEFDAKNEKGSRKSADGEFAAALEAAPADKLHPASAPAEYLGAIVDSFYAAGGDEQAVLEMENVAGATVSANNFRLMMGELLGYNIPEGDTQLLPVAPYTGSAE